MKKQKGQALLLGIIFMAVILIISSVLFSKVADFLRFGSNSIMREQATNLAEAGVDRTLWKLNATAGACDSSCSQETTVGSTGTFIVSITNKTSSLKTITSTGYVPSSTNPRAKRTIKVDTLVGGNIIAFNYAVQVGNGGVHLGQSAQVTGSIYSNANITGNTGSTITGDAYAVGTISSPPAIGGTPHPGSQPSTMPTFPYDQWKTAANVNNDPVNCSSNPSLCNWNGNIGPRKYDGNVSLGQGALVTLKGPVYITGNLNLGQSSQISLDESYGSNSTVIQVDGTISLGQNSVISPTSASPKGYIMVVSSSIASNAITIGQASANAILYALQGTANLNQSAHATAVIANTLDLGQSAVLTYDQGLASTNLTSGPGGSWQIKKGTYRFTSSP